MSLFENNSTEADLVKLHTADHNMNSPAGSLAAGAEQQKHFPFLPGAFPGFPFLPTGPLSLNLTGQLEESSPASAQSEESPKSSPTGRRVSLVRMSRGNITFNPFIVKMVHLYSGL